MVTAAYPELRQAPRAPRMLPSLPPRGGNRPSGRAGTDLPISGLVPGMAIHYAGCCHPLPGDRIVGIVTTGKGVTIHTRDCPTLESFAATPERFIDVDWEPAAFATSVGRGEGHTGRISVIAAQRAGHARHGHQRRRQAGRRRSPICASSTGRRISSSCWSMSRCATCAISPP